MLARSSPVNRGARYLAAVAVCCGMAPTACAQLVAFPGAEGTGRLAPGGRGGDGYHVINLNDTGAGSLRSGISTAPAAGRTIVFDVAGTIHMNTSLSFNGKSKITIAGQTAPAGGITLADQQLRVNNANNVVIQHLRVRPGSTFGPTDPDAIGVDGSTNVIIDNVTASWGVDETISVTNSSNNVTVQWSTMTQGLYHAGHTDTDGVGHSYGSLLNGGNYSYHHNLYAHSKGRFPRAQWNSSDARNLALDWVNNVVYNPFDYIGNSDSDDPFSVNLVGNYAIRGPESASNNTNFMFMPADLDSKFYAEGNFMDADRDLVLDGALAANSGTPAVFNSGAKTLLGARVDLPQVTTYSGEQAYIQVMSRAGANNYRDSIDKRTIRSVFNHLPGKIDTQADWGGWPTLPTGSAPADSNGDGVPNAWASANGFNPATQALNTLAAPDGYTYLEKYIHSLTPNDYAPVGTTQHAIRTNFGAGADAQVNENGGAGASATGSGAGATLNATWGGAAGTTNQAILLRFDISQVVPGSLTSARLDLTASGASSGTFMVYGLEQNAADWNWNEGDVDFQMAPGLAFDGNSGTPGVNSSFGASTHPDNPDVLNLGQVTLAGVSAGQTVSLTNPNLAVFLNLAAYYQGDAAEDVVTLLLQPTTSGATASFYSKEGDANLAPQLVLDALVNAPTFDAADFNQDTLVDNDDLTNWNTGFGMANGAGQTDGDADDDGDVDGDDLLVWQQHFGNSTAVIAASSTGVPEPAAATLLAAGVLAALGVRRRLHGTGRDSSRGSI